MNLITIAKKNLQKNFSLYALYFFSITVVLTIFFCFISFSLNEVIFARVFEDDRFILIAKFIVILLMAFVLFYMSYANTFFMRRRMKELGIYALLGFRKRKMITLLIIESALICVSGLFIGIICGAVLHKAMILLIMHILELEISNLQIPFINLKAMYLTILFVILLLGVMGISNIKFLRKQSLLSLVRIENNREKQIKVKSIYAILGIILLIVGYICAVNIQKGTDSLWYTIGFVPMMMCVVILVVVGTILVISHGIPYIILKLKNNKHRFYNDINIIVIPKFTQRIKTNVKMLVMITLISAATLCILGGAIITCYYPKMGYSRIIPAAFEFPSTDRAQVEEVKERIKGTFRGDGLTYKETELLLVTASSEKVPYEYTLKENPGFELMKLSDYNELMRLQNKEEIQKEMKDNECILVKYQYDKAKKDIGDLYTIVYAPENKEVNLTVKDITLNNPIGFANSVGTLIITDKMYQQMAKNNTSLNKIMSIYGNGLREDRACYEQISSLFEDEDRFQSAYKREDEFVKFNSPLLLIIAFSTVVFFIATGSILYFNNISASLYDKNIIGVLKKLGYQNKKIKQIIKRQILISFAIPYILGGIHSFFALICFSALMPNLLGSSTVFLIPVSVGMIIYTIVYFIYYIITKAMCNRISLN